MAQSTFQLIDIDSDFAYEFPFFPENIRTVDRANWEPQDTTIGTKPLFYANGEPLQISVELYLDTTAFNTSLKPDIDLLRLFKAELPEGGVPGPMLAIWGDTKVRCVLADLTIEESMFNDEGNPTRAKVNVELTQLQEDGESTSVRETEDVDPRS